ncbi:YncE family protein [Serratia rhizosphaerae]
MNFSYKAIAVFAFYSLISTAAHSAQRSHANIFNDNDSAIVTPDSAQYTTALKSGSLYQLALDAPDNLLYVSWGYRLGTHPDAGILAFGLNDLKAKGFIKNISDVYALSLDKVNNRLLAEHTVSRKMEDGKVLKGNSFDVVSLNNGAKLVDTTEIDKGKKDRNTFRSHYIFGDAHGNVFISSESKPKKGGPEGMQKITKYDSSGHELWQSKPFPGLVAAMIYHGRIIAGANDVYEIDINNGKINERPYAMKPADDQARYMSFAKGNGVIYATSFTREKPTSKSEHKEFNNVYVIEQGRSAKGFSTVKFKNNVGVGSTGLAFNANMNQLYTANFNDNTISIIDVSDKNDLTNYKNILIKGAWGVNSIVYRNHDKKTDIYVGIKGGHGENVKHTDKGMDDVKLAKITLDNQAKNTASWCSISILNVKSNKFEYKGKQCEVENEEITKS